MDGCRGAFSFIRVGQVASDLPPHLINVDSSIGSVSLALLDSTGSEVDLRLRGWQLIETFLVIRRL